jgi:hypothetical protein
MKLYLWPPTPVSVSVPPLEFQRNGTNSPVVEDTANPANNRSLPTLTTFYKDGVQVPVKEDTVTPANNDPLPVKLSGVTGDVIVNAGDLSVAVEATNDSVAIGDAVTGDTALVDLNDDGTTYALKVKDDDANTWLASIDAGISGLSTTGGLATEATLADVKTAVESIALEDFATETTLATLATEATLAAVDAKLGDIDDVVNTDGNPAGSKGLMIGGEDTSGDFQVARVNTNGELSVTFGAAGFATETTLTALNNKVANDFGAASGGVRSAAQIGNATGAADFGVGADGAQTLRVSANLKRAGNELSYNSGAADANTPRVVLATRHEADNTPIATRLSNGANWLSDEAISNSQKTISGGANRSLLTSAVILGWDGSSHREIKLDSAGRVETTEAPLTPSFSELLNITNTAQTITAPAGAKWAKVMCPTTNAASLRIKFGGTATATSGMQMQPGRSEDFNAVGNLSVICETADTNQQISVQWGA